MIAAIAVLLLITAGALYGVHRLQVRHMLSEAEAAAAGLFEP